MTTERLAEIKARAEAASKGPMYSEQPAMGFSAIRRFSDNALIFALAAPSPAFGDKPIDDDEKEANLRFLRYAFTDVPDLIEALEAAQKRVAELETLIDDMKIENGISDTLLKAEKRDTAKLRVALSKTREALESIREDACSYICPSTGRAGVKIPCSERCIRVRAVIAKYADLAGEDNHARLPSRFCGE